VYDKQAIAWAAFDICLTCHTSLILIYCWSSCHLSIVLNISLSYIKPELYAILVLYVLAGTRYYSLHRLEFFFVWVCLSSLWAGRLFLRVNQPIYRFYCTALRQLLWKCSAEERIALTAFGHGSLVSVPLFIKPQASVFPLALELCCQNWWNNLTKAGKKRVSGSVENSSISAGRSPKSTKVVARGTIKRYDSVMNTA